MKMDSKRFNRLLKTLKKRSRSFDVLYEYYLHRIVYHITRYVGSDRVAEDVAHEFFTQLLASDKTYEVEYPTTWVYRVCERIAVRMLKREDKEFDLPDTTETDCFAHIVLESEVRDALNERLDPQAREIVYLRYWEGYTLKEIADMMKLEYENAKKICQRAMKTLKPYI
mgnify:FL=1